MMKRFLIGAAFVVAGAGSVGVSAYGTANLKGSDTLFELTNAVYGACHGPGAALPLAVPGPYGGGGSGTGQAQMIGTAAVAPTQQVAPMSRFLNTGNSLCAPPVIAAGLGIATSKYQGLVIALDGVSVLGSKRTFGALLGAGASPACNGDPNTNCVAGDTGGVRHTTNPAFFPVNNLPGGYALRDWRDVLRLLFAGLDNTPAALGTNAAAWAARNCLHPVRVYLAEHYGEFFENNCAAPAGSSAVPNNAVNTPSADSALAAPGGCTKIRHIFRRDDFSGTTDTVVSLLGLPAIVLPIATTTGATPFCNAVRPASVFPTPASIQCLQGSDRTYDPTQKTLGSGFCQLNAPATGACSPGNPPCNAACPVGSVCNNQVCYGPFGVVPSQIGIAPIAPPSQCPIGQVLNPTLGPAPGGCVPAPSCLPLCPLGLICSVGNVCVLPSALGALAGAGFPPGFPPPAGSVPTQYDDCQPPADGSPLDATHVCCPSENAVYRATMQDNDPIRRPCVTPAPGRLTVGEHVCSHSKSLGLVLPMNDVPEPAPRTNADRYNTASCAAGTFLGVTSPDVRDPITQATVSCRIGGLQVLCPNGDQCNAAGGCQAPATAALSPQCLALTANTPPKVFPTPVPQVQPSGPDDGRAFNQHLYFGNTYQVNAYIVPLNVTGAYYRIHAINSLDPVVDAAAVPPRPRTCQFPDMTDQIGCLVEASPCSIGYAGRGAVDTNTNVAALKLDGQGPETKCIQGDPAAIPPIPAFKYQMSRKLYLSSLIGFGGINSPAVVGQEQELQFAGCETNLAQTINGGTTPAGIMGPLNTVFLANFIDLPGYYNNGQPFCEDFNEQMLCSPAVANNPSCANPGTPTTVLANGLVFPGSNSTTCGDGIRAQFGEDCDCGTAGAAGVASTDPQCIGAGHGAGTVNGGVYCSLTCRYVSVP